MLRLLPRSLLRIAALGLAALCAGAVIGVQAQVAGAQAVGEIVFASGPALLDGKAVAQGAKVKEGQQLQTGQGGSLYLKTLDQGFFVLRQNSQAMVVAYRVDAAQPKNTQIKFSLDYGVARHVSGEATKAARQNFRFNTPVAAIGVRGTDFTVFADAQVMRVNVASGGIVVAGFNGACTAAGAGPCEGASSRELFSGDLNVLLQVRRGQAVPDMLRSLELRPDTVSPPRPDEPGSPAGSGKPSDKTSNVSPSGGADKSTNNAPAVGSNYRDVATASTKEGLLTSVTPLLVLPPSVPPPAAPPPPVQPAPPIVQLPRQAVWGRWQPLIGLPADEVGLALSRDPKFQEALLAGPYFFSRTVRDNQTLPSEGRFTFRLTGGEAYFIENGAVRSAQIQNPQLELDFTRRTFATSLFLINDTNQANIQARGQVLASGDLLRSPVDSNATIIGSTIGTSAQGVSYIFTRQINQSLSVSGGTNWAR